MKRLMKDLTQVQFGDSLPLALKRVFACAKGNSHQYNIPKIGMAYFFFLKMSQSWPLFVYFRSFLVTISIQIEKA